MTTLRQIMRYPNRRLYDTAEKRYVTIADIRQLVVGEVEFVVIDRQTRKDMTDRVLLQVMFEQEQQGASLFGREFLLQGIRLYGSPLQGMVGECLRQSVNSLVLQARMTPMPMDNQLRSASAERGEIIGAPVSETSAAL